MMICLRCGYCCNRLSVVIVDDPEIGLLPGGKDNLTIHNGMGPGPCPCKHLRGNKPGEYSCAVHDEPWYKFTPCNYYEQIGGGECKIGKRVLNGDMQKDAEKYNYEGWKW